MHNDIIGSIVTSKAGRDKGRTFVVTATEGEEFVMLADGETRRVSRPKKKKLKHLSFEEGRLEVTKASGRCDACGRSHKKEPEQFRL